MDKSEIEINQIKEKDRQPKGLQDDGILTFNCSDCGRPLLCLQLTSIKEDMGKSNNTLTKIAVKCKICGGSSHIQQVCGQFSPGAPSDHMGFDIIDKSMSDLEVDVLFEAWNK
jgi:hypothetical protein